MSLSLPSRRGHPHDPGEDQEDAEDHDSAESGSEAVACEVVRVRDAVVMLDGVMHCVGDDDPDD